MSRHDFSTCDLCDAHKADTSGALRVLPPVLHSYGGVTKFAGPVTTVKCFEDNSLVRQALDEPGVVETPFGRVGRVLAVDGGGSLRRALVGGNIAAAAASNGWAGVVIDGCVRDAAELAACAVGIRALALVPLQLQGVWVCPGDWLYADGDGIVVLDKAAGAA